MGNSEEASHDVTWNIAIAPQALSMLQNITDLRVRGLIVKTIESLAVSPNLKGKPLQGEFAGYRSVRSVGQRYRIIYRVDEGTITVLVVAAGIRREGAKTDIYRLAQRLLRLGLMEITSENKEG